MSGVFVAASVLFLVYLSQCFGNVPAISAVFLLNDRLKGRLLRRSWGIGPTGRRIFLLNPFLPHVGAVYTDHIPFVVRRPEDGGSVYLEALAAASHSPKTISFEQEHEIEPSGKDVFVDDCKFLSLRSEAIAQTTAELLNQLQKTAGEGKLAVLEKHLQARFGLKALDERLEKYATNSAYLQSACFALFFFVFLWGPAAVFFLGLHRTWFALLLYLILSCAGITWFFVGAYRRIFPQKKGWPLQHMTTIALSPFAAIRANDLLVAELLAELHPVAVARRLLDAREFRRFAEGELRKARFLHDDEFLAGVLEEFLRQNGVEPESLLGSPRRENETARTYCPVCLTQYVVAKGNCQDCEGAELVRLR